MKQFQQTFRSSGKKNKSSSAYSSYYGGGGSYYSGGSYGDKWWEKKFSSFEDLFNKREKRMELRKKFEQAAKDFFVPLELRFAAADEQSTITKTARVTINLDNLQLDQLEKKEDFIRKIVEATDKLPENASMMDSVLFAIGMLWTSRIPYDYTGSIGSFPQFVQMLNAYFTGKAPAGTKLSDFYKFLKRNSQTDKEEEMLKESTSACYGRWNGEDHTTPTSKDLVSYITNAIKAKFYFPDVVQKDANYRKGNRISRGFINWTSHKPLIGKTVTAHKKKKIMIITDGSGSMSSAWNGEFSNHKVMHIASAFMAWVINSDLFEIEHAIIHHDGGWRNMVEDFKKGKVRGCCAGWEGFQNVDETIPESYPRAVDYVVFLTDLDIGKASQEGMAAFLKRAKKHLILSFKKDGQLEGLNVRKIDSFSGMINALSTLLA